jgi:osmotically-inducible protein OsmY
VSDRRQKRIAEDVAEGVNGVKDVHNRLKVDQSLNEQGG